MNFKKAAGGVVLSLIFLSVFFFSLQGIWSLNQKGLFLSSVSGSVSNGESADLNDNQKASLPYRNWDIPELSIQAESGVAVETQLSVTSKTLFKKNNYIKLPVASLTKLMTALISLENYNLSKTITLSKDLVPKTGEQSALELKNQMTVNDLLYIMLIESNNQAAYDLSAGMDEGIFTNLMNQKVKELGMDSTFFEDPTGLSPKNISTVDDLIKLAEYILKNYPEIIRISKIKEYDLPGYGKLINTDELLGEIPDIVGGKTGFTIDAKGCLLLIINNSKADDYIIYVILGADDRFAEMKEMIDWVNAAYTW